MAKASEIIAALQAAVAEHGDLEVVQGGWDDWHALRPVGCSVKKVTGKPRGGAIFTMDSLLHGGWASGSLFREPVQSEVLKQDDVPALHLTGRS